MGCCSCCPLNIKSISLDCNNLFYTDYLPDNIEEIELRYNFNLELDNVPSSIKKIIFSKNSKYNKELNCLSNRTEIPWLLFGYNFPIKNIPHKLKKLICSKNYPFKTNFVGVEVETH